LRRRLIYFSILFLVLALIKVGARTFDKEPSVPVARGRDHACFRYRTAERRFATKVNRERASNLSLDPELSRVARKHTRAMVRRKLLYHTPSNRLAGRVTHWMLLGENVGVGGSVGSLHRAFMHSPPHRANVLRSSFRHLGVGTKRKGRLWVTVLFEAAKDPGTTLSMC
jgi:uncharacterized protein YkwD